ncbi:hypothetical protein CASFOL_022390 [Castilleja foliolosa]|uniref:Uncharacterized protein n=1 Tax=Castilleja foliolosa TaxID=1961234 RepID=A0ABD3CUG0_9LAMI
MDYSESTKVVFQRIEKLDPKNVSKIIGYLLLKNHGELEMIRLAFGPDTVIQSLIDTVKKELDSLSPKQTSPVSPSNVIPQLPKRSSSLPTKFTPFTPSTSSWSSAPVPSDNLQYIVPTGQHLVQTFQYIPVSFMDPPQMVFVDPPPMRCPHFPESTAQICQSFSQGYCKYGGNCRFLHILRMENGSFMVLNPSKTNDGNCVFSRTSLKLLEVELIGLLKDRTGVPVSITSLPIFYYDKYGKVLEDEGYLVEVPGQGNIHFTITQLIAQMMRGIRVIDRPHGRQSIILVEDILKYMRLIDEQNENETSSCQVYLTFPPYSMFCEEDVYNYFNNFGPVLEVRLPNQEKRMFGFVTFVYPETVSLVLTKMNPHFICGAKVLVKPYRIKPMLFDRMPQEQIKHQIHIDPHLPDAEISMPSPKVCENTKSHENSIELENKHELSGQTSNSYTFIEGVLSNGSCSSEDKVYHIKTCNYKQDSIEELNLPESPFDFDVAHGVSLRM